LANTSFIFTIVAIYLFIKSISLAKVITSVISKINSHFTFAVARCFFYTVYIDIASEFVSVIVLEVKFADIFLNVDFLAEIVIDDITGVI